MTTSQPQGRKPGETESLVPHGRFLNDTLFLMVASEGSFDVWKLGWHEAVAM